MNNRIIVVVDADVIVAQTDRRDLHHETVLRLSQSLVDQKALVLYPATAIAEANAHVQRVIGDSQIAYQMLLAFQDIKARIVPINQKIIGNAIKFFSPKTSKKNTFFDCIIASTAQECKADAIFSFDKFYQKNGFKLASELL